MDKNFNKWNELKIKLENSDTNIFFNEWQIWWITMWLNLKQETCGKWENFRRPVLILKKLSSKTFI